LRGGRVETYNLDARDYGLRPADPESLRGGDPGQNAAMLRDLLAGGDDSPRRDVVLLNAAMALATQHGDVGRALADATNSLESGAALARLDTLVAYSQALALRQPVLVQ